MNLKNAIVSLGLILFLAPLAHATKCGEVVYNKHGKLRKYQVLPLNLFEGLKKHGVSSTFSGTTESSTASVDPGVTTGASDSQAQSLSTRGDCKWGGFFGSVERNDFENYVELNMNEIKKQISVGQGGHIDVLASFVGCNKASALGQALQKNMTQFVDLGENDSKVFVLRIESLINSDNNLPNQCQSNSVAAN